MHSEYCNTLVLRPRLILNYKIFSIGIGIVIEFSKLRYWYWYLYWFSKSGVLVLKSVSISEIWNIEIDIGIEIWFFRIKYWYWLIRAGIAHLWHSCYWNMYPLKSDTSCQTHLWRGRKGYMFDKVKFRKNAYWQRSQ